MTPEQELQKGSEAQQLLNNPVFKEVMEDIRNRLKEITLNTPTTDPNAVLDAVRNEQLFASIEQMIVTYIQTGQMAQMVIDQPKEKAPEFRR